MASRSQLLRRQRSWARRAGLPVDGAGHLPAVSDNVRQALSMSALADFTARGAAEFHNGSRHVARMRAVHSSTALAVNVFDHWNTVDPAPLAAALGLPAPIRRIVFEPHLPTGLGGNPANPDLLLELESGALVAVECKFSEWLVPKRQRTGVFDDRYFPPGQYVWRTAGLPECQALAEDLQSGGEYFRYLDVRQLLKHALGLNAAGASGGSLVYLYFDWPGSIRRVHEAELKRLAVRLAGETDFTSATYQGVVAGLAASRAWIQPGYLSYLQSRYLVHG